MKKSCEIICPIHNYNAVIEVLQRFRINYEDEYSIIEPPSTTENPRVTALYGVFGTLFAIVAICLSFYFLHWTQVISYPINVGGQLDFDFISSIPIAFEMTVLCVVCGLFLIFLLTNRMMMFQRSKTEDTRTIYIDVIYNLDLLKSKLEPFGVVIKHAKK